jgi:hypothetical protein
MISGIPVLQSPVFLDGIDGPKLSPLILKILALVQPTLRGLTAYQEPFWRGEDIAFVEPA